MSEASDYATQELTDHKEIARTILADNEIFAIEAQILRKTFDALLKVGFTKKQATTIVAQYGLPL